jgi:hypothetical protein
MAPRRNWRTLWIVVALIVAVAIVYSVASVVSQGEPSDAAVVPADRPVTGGVRTDGGIVDTPAASTTTRASGDTPLTGRTVTDGAGTGTVTDATTGATEDGAATGTKGTTTPADQ